MKKLILPLILAFSMPLWGQAGDPDVDNGGYLSAANNPAFVQGAVNAGTSTTTVAVTVSAVGAGHGLFVTCISTGSCSAPTATGESFSTYTGASGCQDFTGDFMQCWQTTNAAGGETTVNCNTSGTSSIICGVIEYTRPQGLSTPKDAGGHSEVSSGTSYTVSTSAVTTVANDFVMDCFGSYGTGSNAITLGSGFTNAFTPYATATGNMSCGYLVASSTGTQTGTGTAVSSMRATAIILAVKP